MNYALAISHNLFLTREQRYSFYDGYILEVVGVSTPVWYNESETSEPGNEVFCKYKLIPTEYKIDIKHVKTTYEIKIPRKVYKSKSKSKSPVTLINILDFKDGGVEWLAFKQIGYLTKEKIKVPISHYLEIKPIEELIGTMI